MGEVRGMVRSLRWLILALACAVPTWGQVLAQEPNVAGRIAIERPAEGEFVVDLAHLLSEDDKSTINLAAAELLRNKAAPLIVVTIPSMAAYGGEGMRIETFARFLFDQWEIGPATVAGENWNRGMLLLVSRDDRKARIELGAGWRRDHDATALRIMDEQIIPNFRTGQYALGIRSGVAGLDAMARDLQLPAGQKVSRPWTTTEIMIGIGVLGLAIFTIVSLARRGTSGWAWIFWGVVAAVLVGVVVAFLSSRGRGGRSSGYGGGSFGGGFSGGGGSTGSW